MQSSMSISSLLWFFYPAAGQGKREKPQKQRETCLKSPRQEMRFRFLCKRSKIPTYLALRQATFLGTIVTNILMPMKNISICPASKRTACISLSSFPVKYSREPFSKKRRGISPFRSFHQRFSFSSILLIRSQAIQVKQSILANL